MEDVPNGVRVSAVVTKKIISEAEARELFRMWVFPILRRVSVRRLWLTSFFVGTIDSIMAALRSCPFSTRAWTHTMVCMSGRRLQST